MMLIHTYRVETDVGGEFKLIHEVVVHQMRALWIEQRRVDIDPHRIVLLTEIVRQFCVRHQVKPHQAHGQDPFFGWTDQTGRSPAICTRRTWR